MLPRTHRLRDKKTVDQVFKAGTLQKAKFFSVRKNSMTPPSQLLVMVGTKVSKKASKRNRLRRQIQEAFQELLPGVPVSLKVVVTVNRAALEARYIELKNTLADIILK